MKKLLPVLAALCAVLAAAIVVTVALRRHAPLAPATTAAPVSVTAAGDEDAAPSDRPSITAAPEPDTTAATSGDATTALTDGKAWVDVYKNFLRTGAYRSSSSFDLPSGSDTEWFFMLVYITDDDVPELAIRPHESYFGTTLYTYDRGAVKELLQAGPHLTGIDYVARGSIVLDEQSKSGDAWGTVYQIDGASAKEVLSYSTDEGRALSRGWEPGYFINEEETDSASYYSALEKGIPKNMRSAKPDSDGYAITEANIETYVR